jgi:hypothetical protein
MAAAATLQLTLLHRLVVLWLMQQQERADD